MNTPDGKEYLDPTPVAVPTGMGRAESLAEIVRRFVRTEVSRTAGSEGLETFEEANDFDMDDDDFVTVHEQRAMENEFVNEEVSNERREKHFAELRKRFPPRSTARSDGRGPSNNESRGSGTESGSRVTRMGAERSETDGDTRRARRAPVDHGAAAEEEGS